MKIAGLPGIACFFLFCGSNSEFMATLMPISVAMNSFASLSMAGSSTQWAPAFR